ncbi:MAG TPA: hypothetical protein VFQ80_17220 [Thermomicrobiales bacterium]|nr:hypothetical protein [Thermomicrobiales bacterium]
MESTRFDRFVSSLGRRQSRRGALRLFGAALLGAGGVALVGGKAKAASRQLSINQANDFIADCVANGGEPDADVDDRDGFVDVSCVYDDGHVDYCFYFYDGGVDCGTIPAGLTRPPSGITKPITGGVLDGSIGGSNSGGATTVPPVKTAPNRALRSLNADAAGAKGAAGASSHARKHGGGHKGHGQHADVHRKANRQKHGEN